MSSIVPANYRGSTQLNPSVTTYEGVITRIKHTLGYPLVQIEVSDDQMVNFINESIEYFSKYAGYTEEFLAFDTSVYTQWKGIHIEKLINSTCAYSVSNVSSVNVDVVNALPNSYYYYNNKIYIAGEKDNQTPENNVLAGSVYLSSVVLATPYSFTESETVVQAPSSTLYLHENSLYRTGENIASGYSRAGSIVSSNIGQVVPHIFQYPDTHKEVVNVEPQWYYTHNKQLYRSGQSTSQILVDTSDIGSVIQTDITHVLPTQQHVYKSINVVDVPANSYYVHEDSLWKSTNEQTQTGKSFAGVEILNNLQNLKAENILIQKQVQMVPVQSSMYYIYNNQLWYSQNAVDAVYAEAGYIVNNHLLNVIPDSFDDGVECVPVPPSTIYFNNNLSPAVLFRSGDSVEGVEGYSDVGVMIQEEVLTINNITTDSIHVNSSVVRFNEPHALYLNGTDIWKSGNIINETFVEAGTVFASNIPLGIAMIEEVVDSIVDVVGVPEFTYYIDSHTLKKSGCYVSELYSEPGIVIQECITDIEFFLIGAVDGESFRIVDLPPNSFYLYGSDLFQSGAIFNDASSLVGNLVVSNIPVLDFTIYTTVVDLVDVSPSSYYVTPSGELYVSGISASVLKNGASYIGEQQLAGVNTSVTVTKQQRSMCTGTYYDYDMMSYRKVVDCFSFDQGESTGINTLFTLEQAMAQQIYSSYMIGNFGFDLVSWEVLKGFVETRNKVLAQKPHFRFDNRSQILRIIPEPKVGESYIGLLGCYIERPIKDLIKERWVYDYAKALTMIAVGNVRGKYAGTALFGGGSVNGSDIRQQGITEKENLEKALKSEYADGMPAMFFVG